MKYALISDVHGNLQALQAVLSDLRDTDIDELLFLGDAVGYGANPNEVVDIVDSECKVCIVGNHDASALGLTSTYNFNIYAKASIHYTISVLVPKSIDLMSTYRMSHQFDGILLTHATPSRPEAWKYCLTRRQAKSEFDHFDTQLCFTGHTHWPMIFSRGSQGNIGVEPPGDLLLKPDYKYLVNVGSVGQPRDGDHRAAYVIYDSDKKKLMYRRVAYDITSAQNAMAKAKLPRFLIDRLSSGR
ncbi:MAG: metallophosphoesterase family protein [candidate division Zixibacteria bacterium]|nr:metallophosphoesterase family protein [candidate division Zixibacteria bacterium]